MQRHNEAQDTTLSRFRSNGRELVLFLAAPSSEIRRRFLIGRQWLQLVLAFEFGIFCFLRSERSMVRWLVDSKTRQQNTKLTFKRKLSRGKRCRQVICLLFFTTREFLPSALTSPPLYFFLFFSFPSRTSDSLFHFHLPWQWPTGSLVSVINQSPELEGIRGLHSPSSPFSYFVACVTPPCQVSFKVPAQHEQRDSLPCMVCT